MGYERWKISSAALRPMDLGAARRAGNGIKQVQGWPWYGPTRTMKAERRSGALSLERAGNDRAYVDWFELAADSGRVAPVLAWRSGVRSFPQKQKFVSASGVSALGSLADIFVSLRLSFLEHCFCRCAKHPISWRPNDLAE